MTELTKFLISCRMTGLLSNQIMLKIIKLSINSANLKSDSFSLLQKELNHEQFSQFLLLFSEERQTKFPAINYLDEAYPQVLRTIYNPPALLFFSGNIALLKTDCIAIIGSRHATDYSFSCIDSIVPQLVNRYTIVSGLAKGADSMANAAALRYGKTIGVIGSGLDVAYPTCNTRLQEAVAAKGLVISEYPEGSRIESWHFPQRNRIIAGLSHKVIITEAQAKSGSMITANLALEQGREVLALPGRVGDEFSVGCNRLIEEGATPLIDFNSI